MLKDKIYGIAADFSAQSHGSTEYDKDTIYVMGSSDHEFVPMSFMMQSIPEIQGVQDLKQIGFVFSSFDFLELASFEQWYLRQFQKRLTTKAMKNIGILHLPDQKTIFETVEIVTKTYHVLKEHKVLVNGKNLPIQLGEWYAKIIFGLHQVKSSSQRGFDFKTQEGKVVEVKVHWQDATSPKGVKVKKSLVELSDYCVIMYVTKNFTIRDILLLDSEFVIRKFDSKGHTIFLKDQDVQNYFFSKSDKHYDKVANPTALLQFASPNLAMKIEDRFPSGSSQT